MSKLIHYSSPNGSYLLPSGYTRLSGLITPGTLAQYIDTGVVPDNTTVVNIQCKIDSTSAYGCLFGVENTASDYVWRLPIPNYSTSMFCYYAGVNNKNIPINNNVRHDIIMGNCTIYHNGDTVVSYTGSISTTSTLGLFGLNRSGSGCDYGAKITFYKCGIWKNGIILKDYIPVKKSDGTVGLLDLVDNSYSAIIGAIALSECPLGFPTSEYCLVEWIRSCGDAISPYIRFTNKALAANDIVLIDYTLNRVNNNSQPSLLGEPNIALIYFPSNTLSYWRDEYIEAVSPAVGTKVSNGVRSSLLAKIKQIVTNWNLFTYAPNYYAADANIERVKITRSGTLFMDLVPCYRRSDMKPGMYDLVDRVFYTNSGTSNPDFFLGPSITFGWGEVVNGAGKNLYPNSTTRTISVGASHLLNRVLNLGFNGIPGPWTISFDAVSTANVNVSTDICDRGNKTITITPTKLHFSVTATAENYYSPASYYNGFWDMETSGPNGATITITNIMMLRGSADTGYVPNVDLSALPHNISSGEGRMGEKNGSFHFLQGDSSSNIEIHINTSSLANCTLMFWHKGVGNAKWLPFTGSVDSYYLAAQYPGVGATYHSNSGNPTVWEDGKQVTLLSMDNKWHHIAIVGANLSEWGNVIYLNKYGSSWSGGGDYQDIKLFDTVLTQSQIQQEM